MRGDALFEHVQLSVMVFKAAIALFASCVEFQLLPPLHAANANVLNKIPEINNFFIGAPSFE